MYLITWLHDSGVAVWVRESRWGYAIVLTSHALGMALVVGTLILFNLRLLGSAKRIPYRWIEQFFSIAWFGFALNAISGVALFAANPAKFLNSTAFLMKLAFIVLGGVSVWLTTRMLHGPDDSIDTDVVSGRVRTVAVLSLVCWCGALVAGRLIAYTADDVQ